MPVTYERKNNYLTAIVSPNNDLARDTADLLEAYAAVNNEPGGLGRVGVMGLLETDEQLNFQSGGQLVGLTEDAQINTHIDVRPTFQWNPLTTFASLSQESFPITASAGGNVINALDADVIAAIGRPIVRGEWILCWSEDQIPGVPPHYGRGTGAHAMNLYAVNATRTDELRIQGINPDEMTAAGNARGCVVPMVQGVFVDNLRFAYAGSGQPIDFLAFMRFFACYQPVITNRCTVLREGPGSIRYDFCAHAKCYCDVLGSVNLGTYAVNVASTNNFYYEGKIYNTRHGIDTIGTETVNETKTVDSVQIQPTSTLTFAAAHDLVDGMHVDLLGSDLPGGTAEQTHYWVATATTLTIQLRSGSPSGPIVDFSSPGSGTIEVRRLGRYGTPINTVARGAIYLNAHTKPDNSLQLQAAGLSTHAEGWNTDYSMNVTISGEDASNRVATIRSRATTLHDMIIRSRNASGDAQTIGIWMMADDCSADNVVVENCSKPFIIGNSSGDPVKNIRVNADLIDCEGPIEVYEGVSDSTISVRAVRSGGVGNFSPSKSVIVYLTKDGGHKVVNSSISKGPNDFSIDIGQLDETQLQISGNDLTGYGVNNPGLGRRVTVTGVDGPTNLWATSPDHGFQVDEIIQLTDTGDGLPTRDGGTPLTAGTNYYISFTNNAQYFRLSDTLGGADIDMDPFNGVNCDVITYTLPAMEQAILWKNHIDR